MKLKNRIVYIIILSVFVNCKKEKIKDNYTLNGKVFGTTYKIMYLNTPKNYQKSIDSLFYLVNKSLSTYIPDSDISKINETNTSVNVNDLFVEVFNKSKKIYKETNGYFDPTVGNLVNLWGFGPKNEINNLSDEQVEQQMQYVGFNKVHLIGRKIIKDLKFKKNQKNKNFWEYLY